MKRLPKEAPVFLKELQVFCGFDAVVALETLKAHPMNPNTHSPEQVEAYWAVLQGNGIRRPITISRRSGFVTKGHGQMMALAHGGIPNAVVEFQDYDSEEAELADLAADNRLGELSKRDNKKLGELLIRLDTGEFDMMRTGYTEDALEDFHTRVGTIPELEFRAELTEGAGREDGVGGSKEPEASHVRMVQLFLTEESLPKFMAHVEALQEHYGTANLTDTVVEAVELATGEAREEET